MSEKYNALAREQEINQLRADLTALRDEFEAVRAERVQLETLAAQRADEIHRLNNWLTAVLLERDNAIRDAKWHYTKLEQLRESVKGLQATWQKLLETGI